MSDHDRLTERKKNALFFSPSRLSLFSRLYAFATLLGARSPGLDNSRLSILAAQKAMRLLVQEDYNLSTALDSTSPRRQPALAYFVFWALGGFGDMMATLGAAGLEEKEFDLASVLEALARCLLVNQGNPSILFFKKGGGAAQMCG